MNILKMLNFKINLEEILSIKSALVITFLGFFLFWLSFQIPDPLGEVIYWVGITTFSVGILVVVKKVIKRTKNT